VAAGGQRADALRVRVEQFAPVLGEPAANLERIGRAQREAAADRVDLLVTPELSLTGYDLRDRVHQLATPLSALPFPALAGGPDVVVGMVELGEGFVPYNTALHLHAGAALHRHRKVYLPTYGMFDEGRYFGAGAGVRSYLLPSGWRVGLLVCEDLWHPALAYLLAMQGCHLLVVQAAAGGRGAWEGGSPGRFASWTAWTHLACAAAVAYGVYVVLANRVGAEGPVLFSGGSLLVGPGGVVLARGDDLAEDRPTADLSLQAVAAARRPYAHLRDEDPHLTLRELQRVVAGDGG
jgi:predicted amidohydrolase